MLDHNTYGHIEAHYEHARTKHPHFCNRLLADRSGEWKERLDYIRTLLRIETEQSQASTETILFCEVAELFTAFEAKDYAAAIDEAYDSIAVLLRTIDELKCFQRDAVQCAAIHGGETKGAAQ